MGFGGLISKLNEKNHFKKVCVDQGVIDSIIFYSKKSYPNEFLAMFDGHVKDEVLYITGLIFLPGERSQTSASFNDWLIPPNQKKWGSVHSHPGPSARPSGADLTTFSKHGPFHIIVCEPYSLATMKAYDSYGDLTTFEVGNYADDEKEEIYKDLEEIKEEMENGDKELSPSIFDLDQDLSFFDSDEEKTNKYSHELEDEIDDIESNYRNHNTYSSNNLNPNDFSSNSFIPFSRPVSDEDLGSIDLNPQVVRIGGEKVNGQSPNLGIIIEFRDGKPILKTYTNESKENVDDLDKE
ncbi:MAG: Mov34/MPN/PAD-1 family protein [Methanobrevibacter sp.]|nr:Mov34/MPN/PAD-1 family protein [Methanobrevibacter sp.]